MNDDAKVGMIWGMIWGIIITLLVWAFCSMVTESTKIDSGYLTFRGKIYIVELYSELNYPDKK